MSREKKRVAWYSISEDSLRSFGLGIVGLVVLIGGGLAYWSWQQQGLEQRSVQAIDSARSAMALAQEEGGRVSHAAAFGQAEASLGEAQADLAAKAYRSALTRAEISRGLLLSILDSIRNPGREGEAQFIYVEGDVELRRGEVGSFRRARARDVLYDGDYVRSLSSGSAEILFGDDGALFTVRPDTLLKVNRTHTKVDEPQSVGIQYGWVDLKTTNRLGEIETEYAQFEIGERSVATVTYDLSTSTGRFAVDRGEANVESKVDSTAVVALGELEEVLQTDERFGRKHVVPPAPRTVSPPDNFDINLDRRQEVELTWHEVDRARGGYSLQISRNRLFTDRVIDVEGRQGSSAVLGLIGEGNFYWRVAADDGRGRVGPWSEAQKFRVASIGPFAWADEVPPRLELHDVYVNGHILIVRGITEPGVTLEIDGQQISVEADGSFSRSITHREDGEVSLIVKAIDAAGNESIETRRVLIEAF